MARVTVEDCVVRVPNRFELAILAAQRSRELTAGASLSVERDNDKNPVVALREIADGTVSVDTLRESVVRGHQRHLESDEPEEEVIELMAGEEEALSQPPGGIAPEVPESLQSDEISLDALREEGEEPADPEMEGFATDGFEEDLGDRGLDAEEAAGEDDLEVDPLRADPLGSESVDNEDLGEDVAGDGIEPLPEAGEPEAGEADDGFSQ